MAQTEISFTDFLKAKRYLARTMKEYQRYEGILLSLAKAGDDGCLELDQKDIDRFIAKQPNPVARSFLRVYCWEYLNNKNFNIIKLKRTHAEPETKFLLKEQVYSVVELCPNLIMQCAVLLAFEGGMRIKELTSLEWKDFDWKNRRISIRNAKGNKFRTVLFSENAEKYLYAYFEKSANEAKVFNKSIRTFQRFLDELPYSQHLHWHMFRHSCGYWLHNDLNMPLEDVAIYLGHSKIDTTKRYGHREHERVFAQVKKAF